jgi:DNA-binding NarL/FixJ family response regulator
MQNTGVNTREKTMNPSTDGIGVLLVDDHAIFRAGLRALLSTVPDLKVVGEANDGVEALGLIEKLKPDVVVMDLEMPGGDGVTATAKIANMNPRPKVLILTMHSEEDRLIALLTAGASGFLSKDADGETLVQAIRAVAAGDMYVRPGAAAILAARIRPAARTTLADDARVKLSRLSDREREVLQQVAEGYNGPEIGNRIGISSKTVETYKQRIAEKIGLGHRAEYVRFALTAGLIAPATGE